ncbi:MAG: 3-deoxy-7-phosphoheptulonate synthase [Spirochaetes bacterium RBG_13_51_14]|nr:MAG: 3-deoxy-7-phosphoheptulonate synthase [Spirochaetes bacterium RBG_13_51_14]
MSFNYIHEYPSVEEILRDQPLSNNLKEIKKKRDETIRNIFIGSDRRILMLIGPCSAHHAEAVYEYVSRLFHLQERVNEKIVILPRIYTNKPRTTGKGYKGMLHQPDHRDKPDMTKGLKAIREMHIKAMSLSHLPAADEMLYPGNYPYLADILSYVAVGARSVENQAHRLTVSGLDVPVGMKNPTSGDLRVMIDSIYAAQQPHVFVYNGWEVETGGNKLAHGVVRGSVDRYGNHFPNYHYEDLIILTEMFLDRSLENPSIIVDTNHSNSGKKYREQPRIVMEVMRSLKYNDLLRKMVKGFMIESFLLEGSQDPSGDEFGKSITDPCLGWEDSEKLILELADFL